METVRDLSMDVDEMQVVLSAISSVSRRIKEVAQTHKPLFGGEHFLTGKEVCERLYIVSIQNSPSCHFTKKPYMTGFI